MTAAAHETKPTPQPTPQPQTESRRRGPSMKAEDIGKI